MRRVGLDRLAEVRLDDAGIVVDCASGVPSAIVLAEVEHDDAVAGLQDQGHVVLDDEIADTARSASRRISAAELAAFAVSRPAAGSSSSSTAGSVDDRAGDADELRDSVRQRRRPLIEHTRELEVVDDRLSEARQ